MKRILLLAVFVLLSLRASAQYEPTSTWPYLYGDFTGGEISTVTGEVQTGTFNVHLLEGSLHFIDGDKIREADRKEIYSVRIGNDYFVNAGGKMMKVLAKDDHGFVAKSYEIDIVALNSTGAAYGSSSTTVGTMALASVEGMGGAAGTNHMELKSNRENGRTLPLLEKIWLVTDGGVVPAIRRDVAQKVGEDTLKSFLKANKIKWNSPQSLLLLVDLISEHK